jgi:uncharacterized membrane protein
MYFNSNHHVPSYRLYNSVPGSSLCFEKAIVSQIQQESLFTDSITGLKIGYQQVLISIVSGEHKGQTVLVRNSLNYANNVFAKRGLSVIVCIDSADKEHYNIWIYNYNRGPYLYLFVLLFISALCIFGGGRGFRSVIGIMFTMSGIFFLFIPMLYRGYSPVYASIGVVIITSCVSLVLTSGLSSKTFAAILGTLAGISITTIFLVCALGLTHLSGLSTGDGETFVQLATKTHMKVTELLFAGILISSIGAIIDVAISISSSVHEVFNNNNKLSVRELYKSGVNVGRDMMGAMANTLIVAFTGTSLNILILLKTMNVTYHQLVNANLISIYVVQAVAGSIALVLMVPIVSYIAAKFAPVLSQRKKNEYIQTDLLQVPDIIINTQKTIEGPTVQK